METKLTLRLKKKTIEKGKGFAKKRKTSLSKMIENYLEKTTQTDDEEITPLVKSLSGVLKDTSNHHTGYAEYLEKKYK
ncbi:MAG: DUF6364 family protein [Cyclobacteriaceae bacterium]|jgi:hypothetical protein